jgi:ketosteroid isomerase-like protein
LKKLFLLSFIAMAALAISALIRATPSDNGFAAGWSPGAGAPDALSPAEKTRLLASREAVWRAFFTNDQARLERLLPEDTIALDGPLENPFVKKAQILESAKQIAQGGTKLVRLEFPLTEMQVYGDTVIIYTTYLYELENAQGERRASKGRATEIFVRRKGEWLNPGWHLTPAQ